MNAMPPPGTPPILPPIPAPEPPGAASRLRNWFLTGLIVVGPIYITASLTWWLVNAVEEAMRPIMPIWLRTETYLPYRVPGVGLIIALTALTLLGFLTANLVGRTLVDAGERLLGRMPVIRPVYKTVKQIFETLFSTTGSSFRKVALVEFPAGMRSVVFLAAQPSADIAKCLPGDDWVSVFLPCAPNPTTGFFFYAPRKDIVELDISVEAAMTMVMSAGMVQPPADGQKRLALLAEQARGERGETAPPS